MLVHRIQQTLLGAALLGIVWTKNVGAQAFWLNPGGPNIIRLAEHGNARAQARLGFMFATGQRVPQNPVEATYWYHRAAEQGDPDAQYLLSISYDNGRGVSVDRVQAHKWMNLAAMNSTGEDQQHRARMRDIIGTRMSAWQINEARNLALIWRPKRER
jgi:uncharacterized protein